MLDDVFDIAHADAMKIIKIEEDKLFLISQRKKGRPGSMSGGDRKLLKRERKQASRNDQEESRRARYQIESTEGRFIVTSFLYNLTYFYQDFIEDFNIIRDICIFLAKRYLNVWIQSPIAAKAPRLDLEFFKNLNAYQEVDKKISRIAINTIIIYVTICGIWLQKQLP